MRRPRLRAQGGDRPPRHQAGQHHGRRGGRVAQAARLRHRPHRTRHDAGRDADRDPQLHVAGTGDRQCRRRPQRHLCRRHRALRAALRKAGVSRPARHRRPPQDSEHGSRAAGRRVPQPGFGDRADRHARARKGSRRALSGSDDDAARRAARPAASGSRRRPAVARRRNDPHGYAVAFGALGADRGTTAAHTHAAHARKGPIERRWSGGGRRKSRRCSTPRTRRWRAATTTRSSPVARKCC